MKQSMILFVACLALIGCSQKPSVSFAEPLQPDAQAVLNRLNTQCAKDPWRSDVDMIERPETRPANYKTSGEVNGFVSSSKESLAKHGVRVKWNSEKKQYEVEKTQQ
jgi:hypothetical protein